MPNFDAMSVSDLQGESQRLESILGQTETTLADLRAQIGQVRSELAKRLRVSPEPRCSEHALLRYIERTRNIDVDAIRAEIMTPAIVAALKTGVTAITVKGIRMVCKDGVIVTVTTDEMKNAGKQKRQRPYREIDEEDEAA